MFSGLRTLYDVIIGDKVEQERLNRRLARYEKAREGVDTRDIRKLNALARRVEEELQVTEVSHHRPIVLGTPQSDYYDPISPSEFRHLQHRTNREFAGLKDL